MSARTPKMTRRWEAMMTQSDNERLTRVETRLDGMAEDVSEIKTMLGQLVAAVSANAERGNERHAALEARLAVLEKDSARFEKALWATSGIGGGALLGHIPTALSLLGG